MKTDKTNILRLKESTSSSTVLGSDVSPPELSSATLQEGFCEKRKRNPTEEERKKEIKTEREKARKRERKERTLFRRQLLLILFHPLLSNSERSHPAHQEQNFPRECEFLYNSRVHHSSSLSQKRDRRQ